MSNRQYVDILFNQEVKERYLNTLPDNTRKVVHRIFKRSYGIEKQYNFDLYEFNLPELSNLLYHLGSSTFASVQANRSNISAYIDWAIREGYRSNSINPLHGVPTDWLRKFVIRSETYLSKSEIDKILEQCVNYQDAIIISLLFEGAGGKEVAELRNLRKEDVNFENGEVKLRDADGSERVITVSDSCLKLIQGAINETTYQKRNGEMDRTGRNLREDIELHETGYVIKPANTKNVYLEQVNPHLIYGRLSTIAEVLGVPQLKRAKTIQRSGMIWMAKQLLDRDGVLDKEQYIEICERFNTTKIVYKGKEQYAWSIIKEFVNEEIIQELYG